jgi:hypothetical protein
LKFEVFHPANDRQGKAEEVSEWAPTMSATSTSA